MQNRYDAVDRSEAMVDLCEHADVPAVGVGPLHRGQPGGPRRRPEARREPRQVVLAWLLARSPRMLPIPGSGSPEHVAENVAAGLELSPDEVTAITTNA